MPIQTDHLWFATLLLAPMLACAGAWPEPPLPPHTEVAEVARHMVYNGVDMHAQVFQSSARAEEIVAFYKKTWGKDAILNNVGGAQVIGHHEGDYVVTVQVSTFGTGSKGSIGIVDTTTAPKHFVPGKGIPQPMGSRVFNDIRYPDDAVPARTVAMRNGLSPRQNAAYFRERLAADGWKPADANHCAKESCVMYYVRGDSKMTLVMSPAEGYSGVIVNVMNPG